MATVVFRDVEVFCSNCEKVDSERWGFDEDGEPHLLRFPEGWFVGVQQTDGQVEIFAFCSEACGADSLEPRQ